MAGSNGPRRLPLCSPDPIYSSGFTISFFGIPNYSSGLPFVPRVCRHCCGPLKPFPSCGRKSTSSEMPTTRTPGCEQFMAPRAPFVWKWFQAECYPSSMQVTPTPGRLETRPIWLGRGDRTHGDDLVCSVFAHAVASSIQPSLAA